MLISTSVQGLAWVKDLLVAEGEQELNDEDLVGLDARCKQCVGIVPATVKGKALRER